jgi:hypothetical protein
MMERLNVPDNKPKPYFPPKLILVEENVGKLKPCFKN